MTRCLAHNLFASLINCAICAVHFTDKYLFKKNVLQKKSSLLYPIIKFGLHFAFVVALVQLNLVIISESSHLALECV